MQHHGTIRTDQHAVDFMQGPKYRVFQVGVTTKEVSLVVDYLISQKKLSLVTVEKVKITFCFQ